jgi:hypothetical protein
LLKPQHRSSHGHIPSRQMGDQISHTKTQAKLNIIKMKRLAQYS